MRTWMKLAAAVLLLLPFTSPSNAADPETNPAATIEKLRAEIDALRRDVRALQADVLNNGLRGAHIEEEMREIRSLLVKLDRMAGVQASTRYFAPPTAGVMPPATPRALPPTTGTITLRNHYAANATVSINGRPYPVPAGQDLPVAGVPVGPVNIEVAVDGYGIVQPLRTETLRPNGRIITIFPQFGG